ncbi:MAG: hypothetical protein AB2A00_05170 [Myxococcota bacterium]
MTRSSAGRALIGTVLLAACPQFALGPEDDAGADAEQTGSSSDHRVSSSTNAGASSGAAGSSSGATTSSTTGATTSSGAGTSSQASSTASTSSGAASASGGTSSDVTTTSSSSSSGSGSGATTSSTSSADSSSSSSTASSATASSSSSSSTGGIIDGGPCLSGAPGATAFRIRWEDGGGTAYVQYEAFGLPDTSREHAGAYGYGFGYTPQFVDPFLGEGGLQLDGSSFVDMEFSLAGITTITSATLSLYGRSFNTTASGSFNWQTFDGTDATPTDYVANSAPYEWYSWDLAPVLTAGDDGVLLRIKAGPSSGSLVVNRIEICMQAQ